MPDETIGVTIQSRGVDLIYPQITQIFAETNRPPSPCMLVL